MNENELQNKIDNILSNQITMQQDINILKREILGNDTFGNDGYKHRIEHIENEQGLVSDRLKKIEELLYKRIWVERGVLIAFGGVWTVILKLWDKIFN